MVFSFDTPKGGTLGLTSGRFVFCRFFLPFILLSRLDAETLINARAGYADTVWWETVGFSEVIDHGHSIFL